MPEFTHQQARQEVLASYDMELKEIDILPITHEDWNPFSIKWAYAFEGFSALNDKKTYFLVIPDTGKVFEVDLQLE